MSPRVSSDSTPFSRKCTFYQNFDRPWCTMVSLDFVSDSQQMKQEVSYEKISDVVTLGTFCHMDQSFINRRGSSIFSRKERY